MRIGGFIPFSLIDFPGKISCVLFTQGCPFRCPYCHNPELVLKEQFLPPLAEEKVFSFLEKRTGRLEGVVISGGEPTLHKDLPGWIEKIKALGFQVKLDTNGVSPQLVRELIEKGLIDYVAMDIKAPLHKYSSVVGRAYDPAPIKESIDLLLEGNVPYEFRTTLLKELHSKEDILGMGKDIQGASLYVLQRFVPTKLLDETFRDSTSFEEEELKSLEPELLDLIQKISFR